MQTIPSRWVDLEGAQNMRDLGGHRVADGATRPGVLFRSDNLDTLTPADVHRLVRVHGLRLVLDLRSGAERDEHGHGPLVAAGVAHEAFTVIQGDDLERRRIARTDAMAAGHDPDEIMAEGYWQLLDWGRPAFARALRRLTSDGGTPAVIHCTAGKDRTGVLTALLLDLAGVSDDDIVADYAATTERLPAMLERLRAAAAFQEMARELPAFVLEARAGTMRRFLDRLRSSYGGAAGWFDDAGVGDDVVGAWRRRFVVRDGGA